MSVTSPEEPEGDGTPRPTRPSLLFVPGQVDLGAGLYTPARPVSLSLSLSVTLCLSLILSASLRLGHSLSVYMCVWFPRIVVSFSLTLGLSLTLSLRLCLRPCPLT